MIQLRAILESDAEGLFPLVYRTSVTETLVWDGPDCLESYRQGLRVREEKTRAGVQLTYVILDPQGIPVGSVGLDPDIANHSATVGLWIGVPFHGLGYGTASVGQIVALGFGELMLERLEARIYVGNAASRRIFEKNGFLLEGTLRRVGYKRGAFLDEWVMGTIREDYERHLT
jgi:RimJ/RimL family protein N-acetyltransferase